MFLPPCPQHPWGCHAQGREVACSRFPHNDVLQSFLGPAELLASPPTPAGLVFGPPCLGEGMVKHGEKRRVAKKRRDACAWASCFTVHGSGSAGAGSDSQLGVMKHLHTLVFQRPAASVASQHKGSPLAPMPGQHP